jgi:hypothetical protein
MPPRPETESRLLGSAANSWLLAALPRQAANDAVTLTLPGLILFHILDEAALSITPAS